jgi:uncharacterized protein (DUF433 family)
LPWWVEHLDVDPSVRRGKFVVKGTRLLADALVEEFEKCQGEEELLRRHPVLSRTALAAVREYASLPIEMRRSFGAWADESDELDEYLEWARQQRKASRRRLED